MRDFAKLIWQIASPKWKFDDATFDRTAASFENPDPVAIVIHNHRFRMALVPTCYRQIPHLFPLVASFAVISQPRRREWLRTSLLREGPS
jgi:hypothetical protein